MLCGLTPTDSQHPELSSHGEGEGGRECLTIPPPTSVWCHPPSSHSPAKGSLTPHPGHRGVAAPSSSDGDPRRIQEGMDGAIPGDSKVSLLLGGRGRAAAHLAGPRQRGCFPFPWGLGWWWGWRGGAAGVQLCGPQIRELARVGRGSRVKC